MHMQKNASSTSKRNENIIDLLKRKHAVKRQQILKENMQ